MEEPNKLNRETYLDIVGGLLLIYMICWHCALASGTAAEFKKYTFWLGFFLPWFFFKGGLFFKPRENKEVIKIGYKRLIIPFLWFSLIGTIILWTGQIINGDFTIYTVNKNIIGFFAYGSFYGNLALWFLLSLYAVRIIFNYFFIKIKNSPSRFYKYLWGGGFTILCLVFIPYHYYIEANNVKYYPLYISNISSGLAFYSCGYLFKDYKPQIIQTLSLLGIYIFMSIFMPINVGMRSGDSDSKFYLLWIPYSIIGIEAFNNITRLFFNKKNIFSFIGKETMPYYCMHMCVIEFTNIWCYNYNFSNWYHFGLLVVSNVIILPIFTYLIKASRYKFILG